MTVMDTIKDTLQDKNIQESDSLDAVDSLDRAEMIMDVEEAHGVDITDESVSFKSFGDIVRAVEAKRGQVRENG